jgi:hypothetical protein
LHQSAADCSRRLTHKHFKGSSTHPTSPAGEGGVLVFFQSGLCDNACCDLKINKLATQLRWRGWGATSVANKRGEAFQVRWKTNNPSCTFRPPPLPVWQTVYAQFRGFQTSSSKNCNAGDRRRTDVLQPFYPIFLRNFVALESANERFRRLH